MQYIWIKKKRNKKMYLRIKDGQVVVTSPSFVSRKQVESFVEKNTDWIVQQLNKESDLLQEGDSLFILGNKYTVQWDTSNFIEGNSIHLLRDEKAYREFLLSLFQSVCEERFYFIQQLMGYSNIGLRFGFYKSKWGSCHLKKREITMNVYLIFTNIEIIDAILIHEFTHLKVQNHSQTFYKEVYRYMPNYKEVIRPLKQLKIPHIE